MNKATALHRQAMSLVDDANSLAKKKPIEASAYLLEAFKVESEAADILRLRDDAEPSRSVLYQSAARLAMQCGLHLEAEQLIYRALAGNPPSSIAFELKSLLEDATFQRHLKVRGVTLSNFDIQVSLEGRGIGYGIAPTDEVVPRIEGTNLLLYRTAERLAHKQYRDAGPPTNEIRDVAQSFMTLPRAASYAFSIRVGRAEQTSFEDPSESAIDEFIDCLSILEEGKEEDLRERITDSAYYNNFVALAQNIVPDGITVKTVGFSIRRSDSVREVALRSTPTEIRERFRPIFSPLTKRLDRGKERPVTVTGQLRLADSTHENSKIKLVSKRGAFTVYVPEGMMTDIVKPLWDEWVTIDGLRMARTITLMNIRRALDGEV
jgi:hypothetical protein